MWTYPTRVLGVRRNEIQGSALVSAGSLAQNVERSPSWTLAGAKLAYLHSKQGTAG